MNPIVTLIIGIVAFLVALVIGVLIGVAYRKKVAEAEIGSAEAQAKKIVSDAVRAADAKKKETIIDLSPYLIISGIPAIYEIGLVDFLFGNSLLFIISYCFKVISI